MSNNNDQPPTSGSQVSGYIEAPSTTDTNTPKLDVSAGRSAQISFGELGPLVVNADGVRFLLLPFLLFKSTYDGGSLWLYTGKY